MPRPCLAWLAVWALPTLATAAGRPPSLPQALLAPTPTAPRDPAARFGPLALGAMTIRLEQTPLGEVRRRLGGVIGAGGDAGASLRWLCYRLSPAAGTLWLVSTEMGGTDAAIMIVVLDAAPPDRRCGAPATPLRPTLDGRPGLAASLAAVETFLRWRGAAREWLGAEWSEKVAGGGERVFRTDYSLSRGRVARLVLSRLTAD